MGTCTSTKHKPNQKNKTHNQQQQNPIPQNKIELSEIDSSILKTKQCRDKLKSYIKVLNEKESNQKRKAKEYLKQNQREKAKSALALSKIYKIQTESTFNQLQLIEQNIIQIEGTRNQNEVFKVLEEGNRVLKKLQEEVNIEKFEKVSDDLADCREKNQEMNDFFNKNGVDLIKNDEEIEKEIEVLERYVNNRDVDGVEKLPSLKSIKIKGIYEKQEGNKNNNNENKMIAEKV